MLSVTQVLDCLVMLTAAHRQGEKMCTIEAIFIIFVTFTACAGAQCLFPQDPDISLKETDPPGALLDLSANDNVTWSMTVKNLNNLPPGFEDWLSQAIILNFDGTKYVIRLNQTLDLEYIQETWNMIPSIQFTLFCHDAGAGPISSEILFTVQEVNEFEPEFINGPFSINVPEETPNGTVIMTLRNNATDKDVVASIPSIRSFDMFLQPRPSVTADLTNLFIMDDKQAGEVKIKGNLDFEMFPSANEAYVIYNITVFDHSGKTGTSSLTIHILDSDDRPPKFVDTGCPNCNVSYYETSVTSTQTGVVTNILPSEITARDGDTLGYSINYQILQGPYSDYFAIVKTTGEINKTPLNINKTYVLLTIRATEISTKELYTDIPFYIAIESSTTTILPPNRPPQSGTSTNDNNIPPPNRPPQSGTSTVDSNDDTFLIALSVVSALAFIILIALIVSLVCLKKHYKKTVHPKDWSPPDSDREGSLEALTGRDMFSDDLSSNGDKGGSARPRIHVRVLPLPPISRISKVAPGSGDYENYPSSYNATENYLRSGILPPLSGNILPQEGNTTGSNIDKKKKLSRKERKELARQEGEFDGTKSYPMAADPSFYTDGNKQKIRLSSKRKKFLRLEAKSLMTVENND